MNAILRFASRKRRAIAWMVAAVAAFLGLFCFVQLQATFVNYGQEYGAYGQYHRVLRIARGIDDYAIVTSRVRRKLELAHLFHVEEFALTLRDQSGRVAEIVFKKGTDEMKQRDEAKLREIVRSKFEQAVAALPR